MAVQITERRWSGDILKQGCVRECLIGKNDFQGLTQTRALRGSWDRVIQRGKTGGHLWVKPRHLPIWESWAGLSSIAHHPLGHANAGVGEHACLGQVRVPTHKCWSSWYTISGWVTEPTRTQENHIWEQILLVELSTCLCVFVQRAVGGDGLSWTRQWNAPVRKSPDSCGGQRWKETGQSQAAAPIGTCKGQD